MLGLVSAFILFSAGTGAVGQDATIGACAWSRLGGSDQQAILTAYAEGMGPAMNALNARDTNLRAEASACAGRDDVPRLWLQASIASHVIQLGAAESIRMSRNVDRARLDAVWNDGPAEARDCTLHNASRAFRLEGPGCRDRRAPERFLRMLGISLADRSTRAASEQALIYMNAKAQEQIAGKLIEQMPPVTD